MRDRFDPNVTSEHEISRVTGYSPRPRNGIFDSVIFLCPDPRFAQETLDIFKEDYGFENPLVLPRAGGAGLLHQDCLGWDWERKQLAFHLHEVAKSNRLGLAIHKGCLWYMLSGFIELPLGFELMESAQKKHLYELGRYFHGQALNATAIFPHKNANGKTEAFHIFP
ncbi:hypothetical protein A3H65_00600 [Candidatus Giovannonibacteria bacterium RIFCSPLOWO2_02_FULL_45_14]|uniref:Uncharacterized protein n=1 Tax=Candidatus Giovannonibacteria bacterium RIFCSPLOWO2_12_FULL_44_15 TaxID=1798364 RepID=A0A1F5Y0U0_9BACT|nr:MAG: hypothetical protein A3C75_02510 [Candidatus Giovannonibacteria bacterium RIFCSPHIGHO2_02_FULL_44_31]OGF77003.1 MAG: hypothetical protein A3E62_02025 [Candidatus Giovannonibacteria bacterium RIFCSPHIGHO2_12_FULL_44_29]OGF90965.1 MAG: hypothetical protein A3H65_00600 [Candidatus Giovannonibacteria bacterium RIFCSPLOWO2_02_FULL_45_14]OGF93712.1 MAG: hypothetical protein A3G54_02090 [Candidatus Giovannonibacteria bacterium RIFCSPLOWO2_12_FULL_44_15]